MFHEEYPIPTEADFENLPPLVAEGENRQEKLAQVIDQWEAFTPEVWREYAQNRNYQNALEEHPASLFKIDLRDDNPEAEPIDLNDDLLKPLAERLAAKIRDAAKHTEPSSTDNKPLAIIPLLCCKINRGSISELDLHTEFIAVSCLFENGLYVWNSTFHYELDLRKSIFRKSLSLHASNFKSAIWLNSFNSIDHSLFAGCIFEQRVDLSRCTCSGISQYIGSIFKAGIDFSKSNLSRFEMGGCLATRHINFDNTIFLDTPPSFNQTDLRCATFKFDNLPFAFTSKPIQAYQRFIDYIHWNWVQSVGELRALTNISYFALIGVPLLAGLWGPVRAWVAKQNDALSQAAADLKLPDDTGTAGELGQVSQLLANTTLPETMPLGWLLGFIAAFAIAIGQLIYQRYASELIRRNSEERLIDLANETTRKDGINDERLRQAMDYLETAARVIPHRHSRWFAQRQNRIVWVPNHLEQYTDVVLNQSRPEVQNEWKDVPWMTASDQQVTAADRKRIAIEEGEKARYSTAAFTNRKAAWFSGGLYLFAGWLLVVIVLRQLGHIAAASPADWLAVVPRILTQGWFVTATSFAILAYTALGILLISNERKVIAWLEARSDKQEQFIERLARWCGNWKFYTAAIVALLVVLSVTYAINQ